MHCSWKSWWDRRKKDLIWDLWFCFGCCYLSKCSVFETQVWLWKASPFFAAKVLAKEKKLCCFLCLQQRNVAISATPQKQSNRAPRICLCAPSFRQLFSVCWRKRLLALIRLQHCSGFLTYFSGKLKVDVVSIYGPSHLKIFVHWFAVHWFLKNEKTRSEF